MSVRVTFWLLIGAIVLVGIGKAVQSDTLDWDLFWHLKVAEQLRADGIGPIVDRLSFSSIKTPWTPYSWLAELGMKSLWDACGWRVAVAGEAILVAGIVATIAAACVALAGPERRLNSALATSFGAFLTIPFVSFRPVSIAMFLLGLVAWLLLRDRRAKSKWIWAVVPLTVLLTNIHLCVILVPTWIGCLLIGDAWERKNNTRRRYAVLLAASMLAMLATPMLPGAVRTAWYYQSHDVMVASGIIAEMRPVWRSIGGVVQTLALLALIGFSWRKVGRGEWLWLVVGTLLMLRLSKFGPMVAFIAVPVLAVTLPPLNDRALRKPAIAAALAAALAVGIIRIVASFPGGATAMETWVNRRGPDVAAYPSGAAEFVEKNITPRAGRLINEFNWGGYFEWRLGGKYQTFLDGRTQLFAPEFWRATYLSWDEDAARAIAASDADVAILPARKPHFGLAMKILGWRSVYKDDFAEVFVPPTR
jgi:hypothetical protein